MANHGKLAILPGLPIPASLQSSEGFLCLAYTGCGWLTAWYCSIWSRCCTLSNYISSKVREDDKVEERVMQKMTCSAVQIDQIPLHFESRHATLFMQAPAATAGGGASLG